MRAKWYISGMTNYIIGQDKKLYKSPIRINLKNWDIGEFTLPEVPLEEVNGEKGYFLTNKDNKTQFCSLDFLRKFIKLIDPQI